MWGVFVTCYISSGDEAEHHEDPQEHGANGGPAALSPPPAGTATSPRAPQHQPSFPVGPGCTLGCSRNFSPPPSTAHDTLPSETTIMAMLEQEVKLFDDFSLRKLHLQSSVIPKRCWKSAFQDRDCQPCIAKCGYVWDSARLLLSGRNGSPQRHCALYLPRVHTHVHWFCHHGRCKHKFPSSWWPDLAPQEVVCSGTFTFPQSQELPLLACHLASACFPSPWEH